MPESNLLLHHLTTEELIDIHRKRRENADAVWGQLSIRLLLATRIEQENSDLLQLLQTSATMIDESLRIESVEGLAALRDMIRETLKRHEDGE